MFYGLKDGQKIIRKTTHPVQKKINIKNGVIAIWVLLVLMALLEQISVWWCLLRSIFRYHFDPFIPNIKNKKFLKLYVGNLKYPI